MFWSIHHLEYIEGKKWIYTPTLEVKITPSRFFNRALTEEEIMKLYAGYKPFYCEKCDTYFMTRSEYMKNMERFCRGDEK